MEAVKAWAIGIGATFVTREKKKKNKENEAEQLEQTAQVHASSSSAQNRPVTSYKTQVPKSAIQRPISKHTESRNLINTQKTAWVSKNGAVGSQDDM